MKIYVSSKANTTPPAAPSTSSPESAQGDCKQWGQRVTEREVIEGVSNDIALSLKTCICLLYPIEDVSAFFKPAHQSTNRWKSEAHPLKTAPFLSYSCTTRMSSVHNILLLQSRTLQLQKRRSQTQLFFKHPAGNFTTIISTKGSSSSLGAAAGCSWTGAASQELGEWQEGQISCRNTGDNVHLGA